MIHRGRRGQDALNHRSTFLVCQAWGTSRNQTSSRLRWRGRLTTRVCQEVHIILYDNLLRIVQQLNNLLELLLAVCAFVHGAVLRATDEQATKEISSLHADLKVTRVKARTFLPLPGVTVSHAAAIVAAAVRRCIRVVRRGWSLGEPRACAPGLVGGEGCRFAVPDRLGGCRIRVVVTPAKIERDFLSRAGYQSRQRKAQDCGCCKHTDPRRRRRYCASCKSCKYLRR